MGTNLKNSIVLVNQFTIKTTKRGKVVGSKGSTPGDYVTRYMARSAATEPIAPMARTDLDSFITRYMARADAVEKVVAEHRQGQITSVGAKPTTGFTAATLAQRRAARTARRAAVRAAVGSYTKVRELHSDEVAGDLEKVTGDGGVAFGHSGISLSHERLHKDSAQIQELFEKGHPVLKTVLSFDHEYLVRHGIVSEGVEIEGISSGEAVPGAYRGRIDQFKLRLAVQEGLARLSRSGRFDDLKYVGVIQVDTSNVHVHLAMVDAGEGRKARNGEQRGMLHSNDMAELRRGMDASLDMTSQVKFLSSSVGLERRNVASWVKRWAYESLATSMQAQFVLACLPPDRRLWRASTNSREMARPNRLVRALVLDQLAAEGSPMVAAMAEVVEYAATRTEREGLTRAEHDKLIEDGRERIITAAMNGTYSVLMSVADDELTISTPMMSMMSDDLGQLVERVEREPRARTQEAATISSGQFALRLRTYTERLQRHRRLRSEYLLAARLWEDSRDRGQAAPGSEAMYRHYVTEAEYHSRALAKYQHYLDIGVQARGQWPAQWERVEDYGRKLAGMRALRADKSLPKMADPDAAEALGREIYGQPGGGLLATSGPQGRANRAILDGRIEKASQRYARMVDDLIESWRETGASVRVRAGEPGMEPEEGEILLSRGDRELGGDSLVDPGAAVAVRAAPEYDFDDVKGIDLHELGLDWPTDQTVGQTVAKRYSLMAQRREQALSAAAEWMIMTDQDHLIDSELGQAQTDVDRALSTATTISATGRLPSVLAMAARRNEQVREELMALNEEALASAGMESAMLARLMSAGDHDLEQWLREQLTERAPKPVGRTVRVDTGLGGAVHAGVQASVRTATASMREQIGG